MPTDKQLTDETCVVSSNSTSSSDVLSAAFQKQATVDGTKQRGRKQRLFRDDSALRPSQLAMMLKEDSDDEPLMVDVRNYDEYEKARIRKSINVSLPTLLIKRYRRGTVSNFNLDSFIATEEGKQYYVDWLRKSPGQRIVVYDDDMTDQESHAWILVNVLRAKETRICTLEGGFQGFAKWDAWAAYVTGSAHMLAATSSWAPWSNNRLRVATPTQSRSATTFSSGPSAWINPIDTNVQRRASLFSLDTSSVRSKFRDHHAPHVKAKSSSRAKPNGAHKHHRDLSSISEAKDHAAPDSTTSSAGGTCDSKFIISEIVPGFLYLGPEISNQDQVVNLRARFIKQILNMAEECDDDVPGLKDMVSYHKVAARDTVEMQNVEETLKQAVHVIDEAKRQHEPIYVHCKAGKSRSVAAILAYFVLSERWTLKRAYQHVIKARPSMSPNIGFVAELLKLEESVHGQVSNFATPNWQCVDPSIPPSPESQQAIGRVKMAWSS
ncbi:hypothetical protein BJV82DRAFT_604480 [Fennellomyces sp. T-0311]|nr:hypothetical protein BJV82DRAFT_604480 [Fennellomyces sp. T-0311]